MVYKRILVPVDGSSTSTAGLSEALRLAKNQSAKLKLIHIVDELMIFNSAEAGLNIEPVLESMKRGGKRILDRAAKLAAARGIRPETELRENAAGRVAEVLIAQAKRWRADLIVMGVHKRAPRAASHLPWAIAYEVVCHARCPVLTVRG